MERVVQVRVDAAGPQVGPEADGQTPIHIRRPSLAMRVAVLTFLVIVGLPLLILFGLAAVVAAAVFGGLALLTAARRRFTAVLPGDDGRENVRVKK